MRSLWLKLSFYFAILNIVCILIVTTVINVMVARTEFYQAISAPVISSVLTRHEQLLAEAMNHEPSSHYFQNVKTGLIFDLKSIRLDELSSSVSASSDPVAILELYDNAGKIYHSDCAENTLQEQKIFDRNPYLFAKREEFKGLEVGRKNHIWLSQPVHDAKGKVVGTVRLYYKADLNMFKLLSIVIRESIIKYSHLILGACLFISIACGFVADRLVTRRLSNMIAVASEWRKGNFEPHIPEENERGDILSEHGRALNIMADDLAGLFRLREEMAVSEERSRVARELHDTVKQNLFALSLQLMSIRKENNSSKISGNIEESQKITREAQQYIIEMLTQLRTLDSDKINFYQRVDGIAGNMQRRFNVIVRWEKRELMKISSDQSHSLSRVIQEAMHNAVRHGKATNITLNATVESSTNILSIDDNGSGLSNEQGRDNKGSGLAFMCERVNMLPDGQFILSPSSHGGVRIIIKWRAL